RNSQELGKNLFENIVLTDNIFLNNSTHEENDMSDTDRLSTYCGHQDSDNNTKISSLINQHQEMIELFKAKDEQEKKNQLLNLRLKKLSYQWIELKLYFQLARTNEKCFTAEVLYDMYCNEQNLAFFLFLRPVLGDVQRVNKLFESNNIDQTKLVIDLSTLVVSLSKLIVLPSFHFKPVTNGHFINHLHPMPVLGYSFENKMTELKNNGTLKANDEKVLRDR
ncbi:Reverse transcriptase domain-containing protein, partial [Aphis craccivora]